MVDRTIDFTLPIFRKSAKKRAKDIQVSCGVPDKLDLHAALSRFYWDYRDLFVARGKAARRPHTDFPGRPKRGGLRAVTARAKKVNAAVNKLTGLLNGIPTDLALQLWLLPAESCEERVIDGQRMTETYHVLRHLQSASAAATAAKGVVGRPTDALAKLAVAFLGSLFDESEISEDVRARRLVGDHPIRVSFVKESLKMLSIVIDDETVITYLKPSRSA